MRKYLLGFLFIMLAFYALSPIFSEGMEKRNYESVVNMISPQSNEATGGMKIKNTQILDIHTPRQEQKDSLAIWRDWYTK